jgi:transcriptional repressor NrdR
MRCPFCSKSDTQVIDSRTPDEGDVIRRRRLCSACNKRFTTYERVELQLPSVVKKNGNRSDYDRNKLRASLMLALRKRPVSAEAIDEAVVRIEEQLLSMARKEVPSGEVGQLVMQELKQLDKIAYIRFASVYQSFEEIEAFAEVVNELVNTSKDKRA